MNEPIRNAMTLDICRRFNTIINNILKSHAPLLSGPALRCYKREEKDFCNFTYSLSFLGQKEAELKYGSGEGGCLLTRKTS